MTIMDGQHVNRLGLGLGLGLLHILLPALRLVQVDALDHDVDVAHAAAYGRRRAGGGDDRHVVDREQAVTPDQACRLGDPVVLQPRDERTWTGSGLELGSGSRSELGPGSRSGPGSASGSGLWRPRVRGGVRTSAPYSSSSSSSATKETPTRWSADCFKITNRRSGIAFGPRGLEAAVYRVHGFDVVDGLGRLEFWAIFGGVKKRDVCSNIAGASEPATGPSGIDRFQPR